MVFMKLDCSELLLIFCPPEIVIQFVLLIALMLIMFAILASACNPSPCLNGGRCVKGRTRASFTCKCPEDYSGTFCQVGNRLH